MTLPRRVEPEALDDLAEDDPAAQRSRRDLQRIHRAMGTRSILLRALRGMPAPGRSGARLRVLELGAGDGTLLVGAARAQPAGWRDVDLTLLDRQQLLDADTVARYAAAGWRAKAQIVDVMSWVATSATPAEHWDLIVANLFVHHFAVGPLASLLQAISVRCDRFVACEPRRDRLALAGSHLVALIGANAVTRNDAVLSVHAGFAGNELSDAWPEAGRADWFLREFRAGPFSHCFCAVRHHGA